MAEIDKFLENLSASFEVNGFERNETWQRIWLEDKAKQQRQNLQCPECDAFVPIMPETFDDFGNRVCYLCGFKFFTELDR